MEKRPVMGNGRSTERLIADLLQLTATYLDPLEQRQLQDGIAFGTAVHDGYYRLSGEPYIHHALDVALSLAIWRAPASVLLAGLLHDSLKPNYANPVSLTQIADRYGRFVADLVRDIAKLGRLGPMQAVSSNSEEDATAQLPWVAVILHRSPLAVVIKLVDKLHNFQTLSVLSAQRQQEFATAVLRIFVPFAERLGMRQMKRALQDMAFQVLHPELFRELVERYDPRGWAAWTTARMGALTQALDRQKRPYFLLNKRRSLTDLYRIETEKKQQPLPFYLTQSFVIVTDTADSCYLLLGALHQAFTPQHGLFQDFIAAPRPNGYRGLNSRVRWSEDEMQAVAIRTAEMNLVADFGLTAGWQGVPTTLLPSFKKWQAPTDGHITVVTPQGELMPLPVGATPIDFAYEVHMGLGHQTTGAMVNGRSVPLDYALESGDLVQILTSSTSIGPLPDWLDKVKTKRANRAIRSWLKKQNSREAAETGWAMLEAALQQQGIFFPLSQIDAEITAVAEQFGYDGRDELLVAVGIQNRSVAEVLIQLEPKLKQINREPALQATVASLLNEDLPQTLARCCRPMPPEPIVGYITKKSTVTIHRVDCSRISRLKPLVKADWNTVNVRHTSEINLHCIDRPGLVADVSRVVSDSGHNMTSFVAYRLEDNTAQIQIVMGDLSRTEQEKFVNQLGDIVNVQKVFVRNTAAANPNRATNSQLLSNPYTLHPVTGDAFVGRSHELSELVDNLRSVGPGKAVLLWGPRRIGKTSLLLQFQKTVMNQNDYVLGFVDMQRLSGLSTTHFLREIIRSIIDSMETSSKPPSMGRMRRDPLGYFRGFVEQQLTHLQKNLVLIIDEFQLLSELTEDDLSLSDITRYFRSLIQHLGGLIIIFSGGGVLDHLLKQPETSFMLEVARHQRVSFLRLDEARKLIVEPVRQVEFGDAVVERLLRLTAGHPYYLQLLCGELVTRVSRAEKAYVEMVDLDAALTEWLPDQGEQFFNHLWGNATGLSSQQVAVQKLVLTTVAVLEESDAVSSQAVVERLAGVLSPTAVLQAITYLAKMDTLIVSGSLLNIRIPFCQRWLCANFTPEQIVLLHQHDWASLA